MLILSRKVDQRIQIGDDIIVTILRIGRGRVRLAVEAPADVRIARRDRSTDPGAKVNRLLACSAGRDQNSHEFCYPR